jgi:hypothetical protein
VFGEESHVEHFPVYTVNNWAPYAVVVNGFMGKM